MTWEFGQKKELARRSGVNYTMLVDIIAKRKECPKLVAGEIQAAALSLGLKTTLFDWLYNKQTTNPLFGVVEKEEVAS